MANKIQVRRGLKKDMPQLSAGEFGLALDTDELYIGNGGENKNIPVNPEILNRKSASAIIGSSEYGYTSADCDYLCTGTNDDAVFQKAVNDMQHRGWGGVIHILPGLYDLSTPITVNCSVIFEGEGGVPIDGDGTRIDCRDHAFIKNNGEYNRITVRNIGFQLGGELIGDSPFIYTKGDLTINNCDFLINTNSLTEASDKYTDYIRGYKNVNIINSNFIITRTFSWNGGHICSSLVYSQTDGRVNISGCCFYMNNRVTTDGSTASLYILRTGVLSNSSVKLIGNSYNSVAYITDSADKVSGCYIDLSNENSSLSNWTADRRAGLLEGNTITSGTRSINCGFNRVIGNEFKCPRIWFESGHNIVTGNRIINSAVNTVGGGDGIIFKNNILKYSCAVSTSSASIVSDNVVYNSLI